MIHAQRDAERAKIAADVDAFLKAGGVIEKLTPGAGKMLLDFDDDSEPVAAELAA